MEHREITAGKQCESTGFSSENKQQYEFTVLHGITAVKFSPLTGGCLPTGEIKTKKTQCNRAATGGFGFVWLSARSMGLH